MRTRRPIRTEVLIVDPLRHEPSGLLGLLGDLEETEGAQNAVAGLDHVVAGKPGDLRSCGTSVSLTLPATAYRRRFNTDPLTPVES
jgi:hypothetical protein